MDIITTQRTNPGISQLILNRMEEDLTARLIAIPEDNIAVHKGITYERERFKRGETNADMHALGLIHEKHKPGELRPSNNEVRQLLGFPTRDSSVESDDASSVYNPTQKQHRLTKTSLNKKQKKYEHKRRRRVDEQFEHDTILKESEDIMDLESSKEPDSEVQQFDEHPKPWRDGFYCLVKDSAYESDDSNLDMYAEGDGPMLLLEKWVGFKEIGEFTEIIIKDGPLKGTVNEKGP